MKIYNYHQITNEFLSESIADVSPLEQNEFIIPAFATTVAKPLINVNEAALFSVVSGTWSVVPDFRGQIWFDSATGNAVKIDALGAPHANLVSTYSPSPAKLLSDAQTDKLAALSAACSAQIYAGFVSSALGAAYNYPAKDKDQSNLVASVTASLVPGIPAGWTTSFWCADAAGVWSFRAHTVAQIQKAGLDGKAAIETALMKNGTLAAQVMAPNASISSVQAIIW